LGSQTAFHAGVQLAKAPAETKAGWLRRRISLAEEQERELVIDPQFFLTLPRSMPRIGGVDILLKRGRASNEMTNYRYDAVLHIGDAPSAAVQQTLSWGSCGFGVNELISWLEEYALDVIRLVGARNSRVERDVASWCLLTSADPHLPVAEIRKQLDGIELKGLDPEVFFQAAEHGPYDVRVEARAHSSDGEFDVTLTRRGAAIAKGRTPHTDEDEGVANVRPVSTAPDLATYKQHLASSLWALLQERLPAAAMPTAVHVVDRIPQAQDVSAHAS
jgi:hypothetical protein